MLSKYFDPVVIYVFHFKVLTKYDYNKWQFLRFTYHQCGHRSSFLIELKFIFWSLDVQK